MIDNKQQILLSPYQKRYTEEEKQKVLAWYKIDGTVQRTAKHFKISHTTIKSWIDPEFKIQQQLYCSLQIKERLRKNPNYRKKYRDRCRKYFSKRIKSDLVFRKQNYESINKSIQKRKQRDPIYKAKIAQQVTDYVRRRCKIDPIYRKRIIDCAAKHNRKYRARQHNLQENYTNEDKKYTLDLFNHQCAICGITEEQYKIKANEQLSIDHWLALTKLNILTRNNAIPLCRSCNSRKYNHDPHIIYPPEIYKPIEEKLQIKS